MANKPPSIIDRAKRRKAELAAQDTHLPPVGSSHVNITPAPADQVMAEIRANSRAESKGPKSPPACAKCQARRKQDEKEHAEAAAAKTRRLAGQKRPREPYRAELHGRLPDGARFEAVYDHSVQLWAGTLFLPPLAEGEMPMFFTTTASALFRLHGRLDTMYRVWAGLVPAPATEGTAE